MTTENAYLKQLNEENHKKISFSSKSLNSARFSSLKSSQSQSVIENSCEISETTKILINPQHTRKIISSNTVETQISTFSSDFFTQTSLDEADSLSNSKEIDNLKETNLSQKAFIKDLMESIEQMEEKLDKSCLKHDKVLAELLEKKSENESLSLNILEKDRKIKELVLENQEFFNMSGSFTKRTGAALSKEIKNLELNFKEYEDNIGMLEADKGYYKLIIEQIEEEKNKLSCEKNELEDELKKIKLFNQEANPDGSESKKDSENNRKIEEFQKGLINKLQVLKTCIKENYCKKHKSESLSSRKCLKENIPMKKPKSTAHK